MQTLLDIEKNGLRIIYTSHNNRVSFQIAPRGVDFCSAQNENNLALAQVRLSGDNFLRNYSSGLTMLESETARGFSLASLKKSSGKIVARFLNNGLIFENTVILGETLRIFNTLINNRKTPVTVEAMPSAVLGGIPFSKEADESIYINRFRSFWSMEGRKTNENLFDLALENSWANGWGGRYLRYGQTGSMPVRGFHPLTVITDTKQRISWGIYSQAPCSWQHELSRFGKMLNIAVGDGDFEFSHNAFTVEAGATYTTKTAYITAARGNADDVCAKLTQALASEQTQAECERELPIIYNEYCHTWGKPTIDSVTRSARALRGLGVGYFVIDAGWFRQKDAWHEDIGDYEIGKEFFPNGLAKASEIINECGMQAGLWFEPEIVCKNSRHYNLDIFLKRNGTDIINENRKFIDFRNTAAVNALYQRVVGFAKQNGFSYIKADYNDAVAAADGESLGQGLNAHINGVLDFYTRARADGIVLEICASGGHRIEPKFLSLCDMVSFSDAHEGVEGAIVAANLHRLAPPKCLQIWSVVNSNLTDAQIRYRLGQGFLGRLCLSGDIASLNANQKNIIKNAINFYNKIKPVILNGKTKITSTNGSSYLNPTGFQLVTRKSKNLTLIIMHTFNTTKENSANKKTLDIENNTNKEYSSINIESAPNPTTNTENTTTNTENTTKRTINLNNRTILASFGNISTTKEKITLSLGDFDCAAILLKNN